MGRTSGLPELVHLFWCGVTGARAEGFDTAKNGAGGFARNGLMGDSFDQDLVGALAVASFDAEFPRFLDQWSEKRIFRCECVHGPAQVKRGKMVFGGQVQCSISDTVN